MVKTYYNIVTKYFCCNLGGEYASNNFYELLAYVSTNDKTSYTNTSQPNGEARRKFCHIVKTVNVCCVGQF